jgi:hypothetical protein
MLARWLFDLSGTDTLTNGYLPTGLILLARWRQGPQSGETTF